jgi:hypothetical protein
MTIEHDDIERILGQLRSRDVLTRRILPMEQIPDTFFKHSTEQPVCDWLGDSSLSNCAKGTWVGEDVWARIGDLMTPVAFIAFTSRVPVLTPSHRWSLLEHQIAGMLCGQQRFVGLRLRMRAEVAQAVISIARHWWESNIGCWKPSLDDLETYRAQLRAIGLDANRAYTLLSEGFYPADFSQEALERIAVDPPAFADLLGEPVDGSAESHAVIAFVAPNSD